MMSRRASSKPQYDRSDFKVNCIVEYNIIRLDGTINVKNGKIINNKGNSIDSWSNTNNLD